jgi:hypothetical protein
VACAIDQEVPAADVAMQDSGEDHSLVVHCGDMLEKKLTLWKRLQAQTEQAVADSLAQILSLRELV